MKPYIDRWLDGAPFVAGGVNIGIGSALLDTNTLPMWFVLAMLVSGIAWLTYGTCGETFTAKRRRTS